MVAGAKMVNHWRREFSIETKKIVRSGFTIIESFFMIAAILVLSWICLGILRKKEKWPFQSTELTMPDSGSGSSAR